MKLGAILKIILITAGLLSHSLADCKSQKAHTISIHIKELETNRPVPDASVFLGNDLKPSNSSQLGSVIFRSKTGTPTLQVKHISYKGYQKAIYLDRDTSIYIYLEPAAYQQQEQVITARRSTNAISGLSSGKIMLNMEKLSSLPKFMGVNDPLKLLQLIPGVQTSGDGNCGIFVRGGEPGHNLVLFNDAPIYQASHLLGFFSVFNTDHISYLQLHKSDMDAGYGGRLSSVIAVESTDTIPLTTKIQGNAGILASQATLSFPMGKKQGLYLSARVTYLGLILKPFNSLIDPKQDGSTSFGYDFQDYNLTYVAQPTAKDKITINGYWGSDKFNMKENDFMLAGNIKWSNLVGSARWQHTFNPALSMKHTLYYSQYQNKLNNEQNGVNIKLPSSLEDIGYKNEFSVSWGKTIWKTGIDYKYHYVKPQSPQLEIADNSANNLTQHYRTHELAYYLSTDIPISTRFFTRIGLRYACNLQTGPYDDNTYDEYNNTISTRHYKKNSIADASHSLEPRIAIRYLPTANNSIQISYNRQKQFINLVSVSSIGLPTDFWISTSKHIPAQTSHNFSLGYFQSLANNNYEFSVEGYYRNMNNLMEFKNDIFDILNQKFILEKSILYGKGDSYGAEFMVKKNNGRLTGWISYTLGWSYRKFPDLNKGKRFPAKHDRRHNLTATLSYQLNKKWDLSAVFVYATGSAFTLPVGMYIMAGNIIREYGEYNAYRLPDYHRLDLSATYWLFKSKNRESGFNFSIYNAYKKNNPLYMYFGVKKSDLENNYLHIRKKQVKLYDIVPSVSWIFKF